jgi:hypothetical protein
MVASGISVLTETGNGFTILLQICWFNITTERCGKFAHALAMKTAPTQETHLFSGESDTGNQTICRVSAQRQCGMTVLNNISCEPEEFWSYLHSWGGEWLWDNVSTPLGIDAIVDAIAGGTAVLVTDGS